MFFNSLVQVLSNFFKYQCEGRIDDWRSEHFNDIYPKDEPSSEMLSDVINGYLMNYTLDILECDGCGKLWIQEAIGVNKYYSYSPDDNSEKRMKVLGLNHKK